MRFSLNILHLCGGFKNKNRGRGTGEACASPEFRGFTTEKFLASWMYERGYFSCFTGKKLVPPPLNDTIYLYNYVRAI